MEKLSILDDFEVAHNNYFRLLLEHYPLLEDEKSDKFGPTALCDYAIEVHSCAIALGPKARERLCHLGLELLYPFDNVIDLYNWRLQVKEEKIEHTTYASIAVRIDSELKRMRRVFALAADAAYESIPTGTFLVSKERYTSIPSTEKRSESNLNGAATQPLSIHFDTRNIQYAADSQAVSRLEKLEKETTIGANFSSIINTLRVLFSN